MIFYWGNNPMSWMRFMTLKSFKDLNPDWEVTLYCSDNKITKKTWFGPESQDYFSYSGVDHLKQVEDIGVVVKSWSPPVPGMMSIHESDLFGWSLHESGGFYADMDILWIRPMDETYDKMRSHHSMVCCHDGDLSIGFLGSSVGNQFFQDTYQSAIQDYIRERYQTTGNEAVYRLLYANSQAYMCFPDLMNRYPELDFANIPMDLVYPVGWQFAKLLYLENQGFPLSTFDNSIGLHWFGGSHFSQEFNAQITADNYHQFNNTFTSLITEFLE